MEKTDKKPPIIISLGGSLIIPEEIDLEFLKSFKSLIGKKIAGGEKFILICGGGKICRKYQKAAKKINGDEGGVSKEDLDWIGVISTRLNAQLIKSIFLPEADDVIIRDPFEDKVTFEKPILVASGWKPGWSTDYGAVCLAERFDVKKIINLSDIDYVYDKDPDTNPDAQKIKKISWAHYRSLIPQDWDPGLSSPFDPIASKKAEELGIEVSILEGKNFSELEKCIDGKEFAGSSIK